MIASLSGIVKATSSSHAVIEVGGIGYGVALPARLAVSLVVGASVELHTVLVVREDSLTLFGFETASARDFFELLQTVSGIGPKVALSALSIYEVEEIAAAITSENSAALERIPGLGKKGASRAILELSEKVSNLQLSSAANSTTKSQWRIQLNGALIGLGYTARDVDAIIEGVAKEFGGKADSTDISQLLRSALAGKGRTQ
jgi:Holliday junction DNA helicase RuvA